VNTPQISIPEGDGDPGPGALIAANPGLGSRDMRDLLMEFGADGGNATELTQARREAEWRESGQR
jgi:hypothetical protein